MSPLSSISLPAGYTHLTAISTSSDGSMFNVMGVMFQFQPPKKSNGTDYVCSWRLADSTTPLPTDSSRQHGGRSGVGQSVRFFMPTENDFPLFEGEGDVVLLRNVKLMMRGEPILLSSRNTTGVVIPALSIPEGPKSNGPQSRFIPYKNSPHPTTAEMLYAIGLRQLRDVYAMVTLPVSIPTKANNSLYNAPRPREKYSLIQNIHTNHPDNFFNLVGQVVKIYPNPKGGVEVHLTDYTSHHDLFNHEPTPNTFGPLVKGNRKSRAPKGEWPGPHGRLTLTVFLHPPHDQFFRSNFEPGKFVFLRNVQIKMSDARTIEGVLRTDNLHPGQIDVKSIDTLDDRVMGLLERKRVYKQKGKERELLDNSHGQKRQLVSKGEVMAEPRSTKKQRREKREAKRLQEESETSVPYLHFSTEPTYVSKSSNIKINRNVQCTNTSKPIRPLSEVLTRDGTHLYTSPEGKTVTLPFLNVCMRATVRVVDFFPTNLEDFCQARKKQDLDDLPDYSGSDCSNASSRDGDSDEDDGRRSSDKVWEWRFALLVEDASSGSSSKDRIEVLVFGKDAEFLLKLTAANLRKDRKTLDLLREKLFILWGDLEERKNPKPSLREKSTNAQTKSASDSESKAIQVQMPVLAPAFNCCIKEYGVRTPLSLSPLEKETDSSEDKEKSYGWERKFQLFETTISSWRIALSESDAYCSSATHYPSSNAHDDD